MNWRGDTIKLNTVIEPNYTNNWLSSAEKFYGFTTKEVVNKLNYNDIGHLYNKWLHYYIININNDGIYSKE